ncbi:NUDIX domain-containing protein [Halorubrum ezzemoulense]|uniref:NUDIX domain-containing protein n=1 Tax=Halorubrum ezzemoulense TaxID=337243 RepID=A0ABT4Z7T7_HALEZ|nr:NUDIX domain-containing protein [Halorubrum ezzemoulense]MDB2294150.1 NUDIX domain-containing protein [Halorubrum ezzemoulense]
MTDDLLCATVSVRGVIHNADGHILVVQRSTDQDWELPGGRLSRGESPRQGLRREIHEETGLDVEVAEIVKANSWVNTADEGRFAVHYDCGQTDGSVELSDEHVDSKWVRPEKTEQLLCEPQIAAVHIAMTESAAGSRAIDRSSLASN